MYSLLTILIVILAIILILIVLVQNSKGGGLAANFASSNQIMGVRKTTDFLEKTTWGLICAIVVCCVLATAFHKTDYIRNRWPSRNASSSTCRFRRCSSRTPYWSCNWRNYCYWRIINSSKNKKAMSKTLDVVFFYFLLYRNKN